MLEIVRAELARLTTAGEELVERAGNGTVGGNLTRYAELILDSPAVALAPDVMGDHTLAESFAAHAHQSVTGPGHFETAFARYLAAEKAAGRVADDVDEEAFGLLLAAPSTTSSCRGRHTRGPRDGSSGNDSRRSPPASSADVHCP